MARLRCRRRRGAASLGTAAIVDAAADARAGGRGHCSSYAIKVYILLRRTVRESLSWFGHFVLLLQQPMPASTNSHGSSHSNFVVIQKPTKTVQIGP